MTTIPLALQLYTVRDESERDFAGTLRRVAEIGYPAVEFAGYGGMVAADLKALLDELKLQAASSHVALSALENDLDGAISYCQTLGCSHLVLPWLDPDRRDPQSMAALAPLLNTIGQRCREHGLTFAYHNHDFEFAQTDGVYLLDRLLEATDPTAVQLELDLYWAAHAGVDPVAYLRQHADRVALLHLKDRGADGQWAEVGDGTLDWSAIFAAAATAGVAWYIVEHDRPTMPSLDSVRRSLDNLRAMGKV